MSEKLPALNFTSVFLQTIVITVTSSISIERIDIENHFVQEENKMISKQFNNIRLSIKKNGNKKNKNQYC